MLNVARVWHGISNEFGFKRSLHHPFKSCRCATRRQRAAMIPMQWTVTWQPGKIWEGSGKDLGRMGRILGRILGEFQLFVLVSRKHLLPGNEIHEIADLAPAFHSLTSASVCILRQQWDRPLVARNICLESSSAFYLSIYLHLSPSISMDLYPYLSTTISIYIYLVLPRYPICIYIYIYPSIHLP